MVRPTKAKSIELLQTALEEIPELEKEQLLAGSPKFHKWRRKTETDFDHIFDDSSHSEELRNIPWTILPNNNSVYSKNLEYARVTLEGMIEEIGTHWQEEDQPLTSSLAQRPEQPHASPTRREESHASEHSQSTRRHVVFLLHGIRTQAEWMTRVADTLQSEPSISVVRPIRYEFFDIVRFLVPGHRFRQKPVDRIKRHLRDEFSQGPTDLSVISHSFGTYIIGRILDQEPDIKLHRLILCGSVLPDNFDWTRIGQQQLNPDSTGHWRAVNDCGMRDKWPVFAKFMTFGYGSSGRLGFGNSWIKDRYFDIGHSKYFDDSFVEKYWLPYLSSGNIVEGVRNRPSTSWWLSILTVLKFPYLLILFFLLVSLFLVSPKIFECSLDQSWAQCIVRSFDSDADNFGGLCPPETNRYLSEENLSNREAEQLTRIKNDEYVKVGLESFFSLAVLSNQITESEMGAFLCNALPILRSDTDYYVTGQQDTIAVGSNWQIFIWRTNSREVFRQIQDGVLRVVEFILSNRSKDIETPQNLMGVRMIIRRTERFFDIEGIPGTRQNSWVGFDLR